MSATTLAIGFGLDLVAAALFWATGRIVAARARQADEGKAWTFFALFWYAVAGSTISDAALTVLALAGRTDFALVMALMQAKLLITLLAYFGLVYYLVYLYTGSRRIVSPLIVAYVLAFIGIEYVVAGLGLQGLLVETWRGWYDFGIAPEGPSYLVSVSLLYLPPLAAALAYASLWRVTATPTARYRLAVVAASLILYFFGSYAALLNYAWPHWALVHGILQIVAASGVYFALRPPAWAQRRFGAEPLGGLAWAPKAGVGA